jgi:hypothetical protein
MKKNTSNFPLPTFYGSAGYLGLPQTQNRYAYCINNPFKYIDPLGLISPEELLWLGEGLIAWTFYDDIWIGVITLRPLEGPDPGTFSDWLSEGLIGADEGAYSDPWGDDYGGGYLGGSRGGNIRSPYGGSGAGDAPPGGGSAPADATSFTPPDYVAPPGYLNWVLHSDPLGYEYAYDPNWYTTHELSRDLTGLITDEILWAFVSGGIAKALQLETNILSDGNVFKIVSKKYGVGFRIDPAHHGKPWGHMKIWTWPPKYP